MNHGACTSIFKSSVTHVTEETHFCSKLPHGSDNTTCQQILDANVFALPCRWATQMNRITTTNGEAGPVTPCFLWNFKNRVLCGLWVCTSPISLTASHSALLHRFPTQVAAKCVVARSVRIPDQRLQAGWITETATAQLLQHLGLSEQDVNISLTSIVASCHAEQPGAALSDQDFPPLLPENEQTMHAGKCKGQRFLLSPAMSPALSPAGSFSQFSETIHTGGRNALTPASGADSQDERQGIRRKGVMATEKKMKQKTAQLKARATNAEAKVSSLEAEVALQYQQLNALHHQLVCAQQLVYQYESMVNPFYQYKLAGDHGMSPGYAHPCGTNSHFRTANSSADELQIHEFW